MPDPERLATQQLDAYNRADLEAFCACYADDVRVLADDGAEVCRGIDAFRKRYVSLFEGGDFGATVESRIVVGVHCVDRERWWRLDPETGERAEGVVLVRYRVHDEAIAEVQFFR